MNICTNTTAAADPATVNVLDALQEQDVLDLGWATKVIVHGGRSSHMDEQVACALAYAFGCRAAIERRDPTPEELKRPNVLVMDVGGQLDGDKLCFDHHQLPRSQADCAFSLLAKAEGCWEDLCKIFPWAETAAIMDQQGPNAAAAHCEAQWPFVKGLVLTPSRQYHDERWAQDAEYRQSYTVWLGTRIAEGLMGLDEARKATETFDVKDLTVLDIRAVPENLSWLSDTLAAEVGAAVILFKDDRGPGFGLLRVNDHPRVDFTLVDGDPEIVFAHKGGFIAKTVAGANVHPLIEKAVKDEA